jgi:hypothetical protein
MTRSDPRRPSPLAGFVVGLVAGALGGVLMIAWGVGMPWLGVAAIIVGGLAPPRPVGLGGALISWGATWLALFLRADAACDPASCRGPDIRPWLVVATATVLLGIGLLAIHWYTRRAAGRR